ncbi:MAG: PAS domain S-box protein [bacterium]|nr:PAS domain S-box protein [bacterium]
MDSKTAKQLNQKNPVPDFHQESTVNRDLVLITLGAIIVFIIVDALIVYTPLVALLEHTGYLQIMRILIILMLLGIGLSIFSWRRWRELEQEYRLYQQATDVIKQKEAELRAQYQGFPIPTYTWQKQGDDFVLVDCNHAAENFTQGGIRQFIGKTLRELIGNRPEILADFEKCFAEKGVVKREITYHFQSIGETKIFNSSYVYIPSDIIMVHTEDITQQRLAEQSLRESEMRYRTMVENVNFGVFRNTVQGQFIFANRAVAAMHGYDSVEEFIQVPIPTLYQNPEERQQYLEELRQKGELKNREVRLRKKDGTIFWGSVTARAQFAPDGTIAWIDGVIEDITLRKQMELELLRNQIFLDSVVENIPNMMFVKEAENLRYVRINRAGEELLGYNRKEILGKNDFDLFPIEDATLSTIKDQEILAGEKLVDILEERIETKYKGSRILRTKKVPIYDPTGKPKYLLGISEDITEQKLAEKRLRENEAILSTLMNTSPDSMALLDTNGNVLMLNNAAARRLKKSVDDLIGVNIFDVFPPIVSGKRKQYFETAIRTGNVVRFEDERDEMVFDNQFCPILDSTGKVGQVAVFAREITEQKRNERILRASEEKFATAFNSSPALMAINDLENQAFLDVNEAFLKTLGYQREEIIGKTPVSLNGFPNITEYYDALTLLNEQGRFRNVEIKMRTKTKAERIGLFSGEIIEVAGKKCILTAAYDITELYNAKQALQESEQRYRLLLDLAPYPIMIHRNGIMEYVNQACCKVLHANSPEQILGKPLLEFVTPEFQPLVRDRIRMMLEQGKEAPLIELKLKGIHGEVIDAEIASIPIQYLGSQSILVVGRDITEKKRQQEFQQAITELGEKVGAAVTPEMVAQELVATADQFFGWDSCAVRIYDEETMTVSNLLAYDIINGNRELVTATLPAQFSPMTNKVFEEGAKLLTETEIAQLPEGVLIPFGDVSRFPKTMMLVPIRRQNTNIGIATIQSYIPNKYTQNDLTLFTLLVNYASGALDRTLAREKLRQRERRYRRAIALANAVPFELDRTSMTYTFIDEGIKELTGYSNKEITIERWKSLIQHVELCGKLAGMPLEEAIERSRLGEITEWQAEVQITTRSGQMKWIAETNVTELNSFGNPVRTLGILQDITVRKLAEENMKQYQEELRRLAAELTLTEERERRQIAQALHDNIGQILALCKIKLGELEVAPAISKLSDEIRSLIEQAIQYIRTLTIELSPPILYDVGFEAAIRWLAEQIQLQYNIPIRVKIELKSQPLPHNLQVLLYQLIRELLVNVGKHARARHAKLTLQQEGHVLNIQVADNGIGFSIFEFDINLMKAGKYGLFNVQEQIKNIGGNMQVMSAPGKGTTVTLSVPLNQVE